MKPAIRLFLFVVTATWLTPAANADNAQACISDGNPGSCPVAGGDSAADSFVSLQLKTQIDVEEAGGAAEAKEEAGGAAEAEDKEAHDEEDEEDEGLEDAGEEHGEGSEELGEEQLEDRYEEDDKGDKIALEEHNDKGDKIALEEHNEVSEDEEEEEEGEENDEEDESLEEQGKALEQKRGNLEEGSDQEVAGRRRKRRRRRRRSSPRRRSEARRRTRRRSRRRERRRRSRRRSRRRERRRRRHRRRRSRRRQQSSRMSPVLKPRPTPTSRPSPSILNPNPSPSILNPNPSPSRLSPSPARLSPSPENQFGGGGGTCPTHCLDHPDGWSVVCEKSTCRACKMCPGWTEISNRPAKQENVGGARRRTLTGGADGTSPLHWDLELVAGHISDYVTTPGLPDTWKVLQIATFTSGTKTDKVGAYQLKSTKECAIAFSCMDPTDEEDRWNTWFENYQLPGYKEFQEALSPCGIPRAREGFFKEFQNMMLDSALTPLIAKLDSSDCAGGIYSVGFSLGGVMASFFAACTNNVPNNNIYLPALVKDGSTKPAKTVPLPKNNFVEYLFTFGSIAVSPDVVSNSRRHDGVFPGKRYFQESSTQNDLATATSCTVRIWTPPLYWHLPWCGDKHPKVDAVRISQWESAEAYKGANRIPMPEHWGERRRHFPGDNTYHRRRRATLAFYSASDFSTLSTPTGDNTKTTLFNFLPMHYLFGYEECFQDLYGVRTGPGW